MYVSCTKYHISDIGSIMLTGPSEQVAATTLNSVNACAHQRWEINPTKIQGPSTSVKFLGVQWCGAYKDSPSKVKDKLLHLAPPTTKNEAQCLVGPFGFWRPNIPHLGVVYQPIHQVTQKAARFVWGLNRGFSMGPDCCSGCSTTWTT